MASNSGGNLNSSELDDQIREYLVYRGFTAAARSFEAELAKSNSGPAINFTNTVSSGFVDKSCNVDKIVDTLMNLIAAHDLVQLTNLWSFLRF